MELDSFPTLCLQSLEDCLCSKPVLLMLNHTKLFKIESDTSLYATGTILLQQDTNGDWHPVAYYSQSMNLTEPNYQVYNRELMAIICLLHEWRCYIYGSSFMMIVW